MRILDIDDKEVLQPDLSVGYIVTEERIRPDATPIDNINKFAWYDEDYETIYRYHIIPNVERIEKRILELKQQLSDTDYIVSKVVEGSAVWDDYPNIREKRQAWRNEINNLELEIKELDN